MSEDEELQRAFGALRKETEPLAPKFDELLQRHQPRAWLRESRRTTWRPGRAAVFAATAVGLAALVIFLRFGTPFAPRRASSETLALLAWKAPTDFLLDTPGSELMHSVPRLIDPATRSWFPPHAVPASGAPPFNHQPEKSS